MDPMEFFISY